MQEIRLPQATHHQTEDRYRLLLEAVNDIRDYAIFMLDAQGIIQTWNAGARRINGYAEEEVVGKHFSIFYTNEDLERNHPDEEIRIATKEGKFEEEGWRVRKDGTKFWASVLITRYCAPDGTILGFSKVTRDLTERKWAEELERTLHFRDEFLALASHELRTPITSLKLQAQMLLSLVDVKSGKVPAAQKIATSLQTVVRQSDRLSRLVNDLLDVSRVQLGKFTFNFERADISELIQSILSQWNGTLQEAGCSLVSEVVPGIFGTADSYGIEQVVVNLLSNAMKYAPGASIHVTLGLENQNAILNFRDTGPGIDPSRLDNIFEPFERAASSSEVRGMGLGLYIVKTIIDAHHGTIDVQSAPGIGTTFTIRIPLNIQNV